MAENTIALITGANKGIGKETARQFGERGMTVLVGARNEGRGEAAADELRGEGADAHFVQLDVTDEASVETAAKSVDARFGRLDILVNNAAISVRAAHAVPSQTPVGAVRETYETNVFGVVAVTNAMLPLLRRSPSGRVLNVSSGLGSSVTLGDPDSPWAPYTLLLAYNSSKAALNAITQMYAAELRDTPITVNAVTPGFCATDLNDHRGLLHPAEGARKVVGVAILPDGTTGAFLGEDGPLPW